MQQKTWKLSYLICAVSFQFIQFFMPSNKGSPNHSQSCTKTMKGQSGLSAAGTNLEFQLTVLFLLLKIKRKLNSYLT